MSKPQNLLEQKKTIIKDFIAENMGDDELERGEEFDEWKFSSVYKFYEFNNKKVDNCDEEFINWLIHLIVMIKKKNKNQHIHNMDKESMVCFETSGFCWDKKGKFVIFNEQ